MKTKLNNKYTLTRRVLISCMAAVIFLFAGDFNQFCVQDAEAFFRSGSCGKNKLCKELEGKEFDQIMYSSKGSELVVLFEVEKHGDVTLFSRDSSYTRTKGTINDAIQYLSGHPDHMGFRVLRARKTTGWFSAEIIDGMYIIEPKYHMPNENIAPNHNISEKDGQFTVYLRFGFPDKRRPSYKD